VKPKLLGTKTFIDFPLEDVLPFIDWNPFFQACNPPPPPRPPRGRGGGGGGGGGAGGYHSGFKHSLINTKAVNSSGLKVGILWCYLVAWPLARVRGMRPRTQGADSQGPCLCERRRGS